MQSKRRAILFSFLSHLVLFLLLAFALYLGKKESTLQGVVAVNMVSQEVTKKSALINLAPNTPITAQAKKVEESNAQNLNPGSNAGDLVLTIRPEYPRASRSMGEEGEVLIRALVSVDGKISSAQVVRSSGYPRLDEAAKAAVEAASLAGKLGKAAEKEFNIVFRLQ